MLESYRAGLMRRAVRVAGFTLLVAAVACANADNNPPRNATAVSAQSRKVVITIDDLPFVSTRGDSATVQTLTAGIVGALSNAHVPAMGFVNENKLERNGKVDPARVALLEQWLHSGLDLGNHTYAHRGLHDITLEQYEQDVLLGERETKKLLAKHGRKPEWFRHPFLHAGRDTATQQALSGFLAQNGYRIAPVTIDNSDYVFARAYDLALDRNDTAFAKRIGETYLAYMDTVFGFYEQQSRTLLGYELPQTLLLHANRLNAVHMERLLAMIIKRGYTFTSLEEALKDPAYQRVSGYTGPAGISWLQRWAMAENRPRDFYLGEPVVPPFVAEAAR